MNTILIVCMLAGVAVVVERLQPNVSNPTVPQWWVRVGFFNSVQAAIAFLSAHTWDQWMAGKHLLSLGDDPIALQVVMGYLLITFVYYWWHRARHEIPALWRWLHQLHHSPTRMEVLMSFYKHPLEIVANGVLSSLLLYAVLGLSAPAVALTVTLTGVAELFYHWNIRTPYWLGFLIQRPESHRIHHQRDRHTHNYSDLPIWDWMFGTLKNARGPAVDCGFSNGRENHVLPMLIGKDVHKETSL